MADAAFHTGTFSQITKNKFSASGCKIENDYKKTGNPAEKCFWPAKRRPKFGHNCAFQDKNGKYKLYAQTLANQFPVHGFSVIAESQRDSDNNGHPYDASE